MPYEAFDFEKQAKKCYHNTIVYTKHLSEIANTNRVYSHIAIYALYENNQLMKIGKAISGGLHHRMVQYYNRNKSGGSKYITDLNKDAIVVKYFTLEDKNELWYAERRLQVIAHDCREKMEWENTSRN